MYEMYYVIHRRKRIYADLTVETIYLPEEKYLCWLDWRYNVFTVGKVFLLTWFRERRTSPIWWPWYRHRPGKPIWLRGNENHQNPLEQQTTESHTHHHHPYGEVSSKSDWDPVYTVTIINYRRWNPLLVTLIHRPRPLRPHCLATLKKTSADEQFHFSQTFSFYDFFVFEFGLLHFSLTVKCNSKQGLSLLVRWSHEIFIVEGRPRCRLQFSFNCSKSTPGDVGTHWIRKWFLILKNVLWALLQ